MVRQFSGYVRTEPALDQQSYQVSNITRACDIKKGPPLVSDEGKRGTGKSFGNGEMGGNIEGLPGGLCLVGDNLATSISSEFCGGAQNVVQARVSWLGVGHVDEVMKVIPTADREISTAHPTRFCTALQQPMDVNMKHLIFFGMLFFSLTAIANLDPDLECSGETKEGDKLKVFINDMDFAKQIAVKKGKKSCSYQIITSMLIERGVAPGLTFKFESQEGCDLSDKIKLQKQGFVKIILRPQPQIYVLALIGEHPFLCEPKSLKIKKLKDRAVKLF